MSLSHVSDMCTFFFYPQALYYWGVYAVGYISRPIGALLFGHFADKVSRKKTLVFSIISMALPTVLTGCLPTYSQIGVAAPILLCILRFLQGLAVGGEYGTSLIYISEIVMPMRQGLVGGLLFVSAEVSE
jgi:MFS family permease